MERVPKQHIKKTIQLEIWDTNKARLRQYFANIHWQCVINQPISEEKLQVYSNLVETDMSHILPERSMKPNPSMRPGFLSMKLK